MGGSVVSGEWRLRAVSLRIGWNRDVLMVASPSAFLPRFCFGTF